MKTAIVTGTSSGIGLAICQKLIDRGYRVYGLARNFTKTEWDHPHFHKMVCDVSCTRELSSTVRKIRQEQKEIHVLVNNAGIGYFGPHETLKPEEIEAMVATNLQAPLILTRLLLNDIKRNRGWIINISSITAQKSATHGCAYAATKAGLTHFGISLFDEIRKTGAKVVTLHPDIVQTPFYDHLDFKEGEEPDSYITAQCVADAVETVLNQREGTVLTEMTIRPQLHRITKKKRGKS
ncbi:MAG: SDR family oxidoreductase [Bacillaceae bacterium]|nr:SDR family oxidoreductase [Bacillaceae bacterium]